MQQAGYPNHNASTARTKTEAVTIKLDAIIVIDTMDGDLDALPDDVKESIVRTLSTRMDKLMRSVLGG